MAQAPPVFTDEQRAAAVSRLLEGEAVKAVARDYGVQPSTVRGWRAKLGADPRKEQHAEAEVDFRKLTLRYLEHSLAAGERVLGQTEDKDWLGKQSAADLAVFLGVVFDKAARVLAALGDGGAAGSDQVDTRSPGLPAPG